MRDQIKLLIKANQSREEKQHLKAITYFTRFLDDYNDADIMGILASTYFKLSAEQPGVGDFIQKAIQWSDKAIALEPNRAEFYVTRGDILSYGIDAPNYREALDSYRRALKLNPNLVEACIGLASLEGVPDKVISLSEAIAVMKHASEVRPENPYIHLRLGTLYKEAGHISEAQSAFKRALLCPESLSLRHVKTIVQMLNLE